MAKCAKCSKLLTKKSPGLQCSKCSKWLHASCASITADQLNVLHNTDSVDWKCKNCNGGGNAKRLSCIVPDFDCDDNTDSESTTKRTNVHSDISMHQVLRELRKEVRQVIQDELQSTLKYFSDKMDDYEGKIQKYEKSTKELENRCSGLQNNLKNTNLRCEVLENKLNQLEQVQLCNQLEICGVNPSEKDSPNEVAKKISVAISQNPDDVVNAYIKKKHPSKAKGDVNQLPTITVILREGTRDVWIDAAKNTKISATSVGLVGADKVYLRESLTPATAYLLWKTKQDLKGIYDYIWCKHGNILVRKNEREKKILTIRSTTDIDKVKSSHG